MTCPNCRHEHLAYYCEIAQRRLGEKPPLMEIIDPPRPATDEQGDLFHRMSDQELRILKEQDEARELALSTEKPDA